MEEDFWYEFNLWVKREAAEKVVLINETTKLGIRNIIRQGMEEQLNHRLIAKNLLDKGFKINIARARRIARTETGMGAAKSIDFAMGQTRLMKEKEWVSALDSRTRTKNFNHVRANGERVAMDGMFMNTGEDLEYPKDSGGSAGNVINCRCVALYHTRIKPAA